MIARPVPQARQPAGRTNHRDLAALPVQGQPLCQIPRPQHLHRHPQRPVMRTYTNLTWPDDPYRTGQQLYRRPVPRLAAFATGQTAAGGRLAPAAVAIVYLPLHRTRTVTVTEHTLTFGFRAASADDPADVPALAAIADLDLMQARRHAAVLAGHLLSGDLAVLRQARDAGALRGLAAVEREWPARGQATGKAATFDSALDLPDHPSLEHACQRAGIAAS